MEMRAGEILFVPTLCNALGAPVCVLEVKLYYADFPVEMWESCLTGLWLGSLLVSLDLD